MLAGEHEPDLPADLLPKYGNFDQKQEALRKVFKWRETNYGVDASAVCSALIEAKAISLKRNDVIHGKLRWDAKKRVVFANPNKDRKVPANLKQLQEISSGITGTTGRLITAVRQFFAAAQEATRPS
jgi:hypothetical protein